MTPFVNTQQTSCWNVWIPYCKFGFGCLWQSVTQFTSSIVEGAQYLGQLLLLCLGILYKWRQRTSGLSYDRVTGIVVGPYRKSSNYSYVSQDISMYGAKDPTCGKTGTELA